MPLSISPAPPTSRMLVSLRPTDTATALLCPVHMPTSHPRPPAAQHHQVMGMHGANATARLLAARGVSLEVVVDEGGMVLADGLKPFTREPVALVATAEKVGGGAGEGRSGCFHKEGHPPSLPP